MAISWNLLQILKFNWCSILTGFLIQWTVLNTVRAQCPNNVHRHAFKCFTVYNTHLLNMQKSHRTLFSGVDVEILRAFCTSYLQTEKCIHNLKIKCPKHEDHYEIDRTLTNLEGARDELNQLCKTENIYEIYARHMTCFYSQGSYTESCFENIMNTSTRLMKRMQQISLDDLCGDLNRVLQCIKGNIERRCGVEAAALVNVLVKPMVRRSTLCDRISFTEKAVPQERTTPTEPEIINHHVIQVRHDDFGDGSFNSGSTGFILEIRTLLLCISILLALMGL